MPVNDVSTIPANGRPPTAAEAEPSSRWGYRSYRDHLAARFPGLCVRKLCLDAGFSCPNIDGTVARGGCTYCSNRGFVPGGSSRRIDLRGQWDAGRAWLRHRYRRVDAFIAYFQAYTNTHASLDRLRELYDPLPTSLPECVGVSISTRPDCLPDPALDYLALLARRTWLTVEIGLQSDRDAVLAAFNRGHGVADFRDAVARAAERGFELCAHVMLGCPGEGDDAPERLGDLLGSLPVSTVKIHNLHVMRGTALAQVFRAGQLVVPDQAHWLDLVARCLTRLRPDQAAQRVIADAPRRLLLSDPWCRDKQGFLRVLRPKLQQRAALQGSAFR